MVPDERTTLTRHGTIHHSLDAATVTIDATR
jgi:hypothetical protein